MASPCDVEQCEQLGCTEPADRWCVWWVENRRGQVKQCKVVLCRECYPRVRKLANGDDL